MERCSCDGSTGNLFYFVHGGCRYQRGVTDGLRPPFNIRDLTRPCTKGLNLCEAVNLKE